MTSLAVPSKDGASSSPKSRPSHIDVDDIDDDLELSDDDDIGLESRRGSYLRNDGRGWTQHYSMGGSGSGNNSRGAGPESGSGQRSSRTSLTSEQYTQQSRTPHYSHASSLTPSVEGGYNVFKPPHQGKFALANESPETMDDTERDDVMPLSAITANGTSVVPITHNASEAAALRRGSAQLDTMSSNGSKEKLRGSGRVPSAADEEDSRFDDADEGGGLVASNSSATAGDQPLTTPFHDHLGRRTKIGIEGNELLQDEFDEDDYEDDEYEEEETQDHVDSAYQQEGPQGSGPHSAATRQHHVPPRDLITDDSDDDDHYDEGTASHDGAGKAADDNSQEDEAMCVSFQTKRPRSRSVLAKQAMQ